MSHNAEWEEAQARKLVGYTIKGSVLSPGRESFGLILTMPAVDDEGRTAWKEIVVWVDSDEEGNACGHLSFHLEEQPHETG